MAMDMFIKLGDIKGESKDSTYKDKIDVLAWSWGMSQSANAQMGGGGGSGKVAVQDLSFTKYIDLSSTSIIQAVTKGTHLKECVLVVRKAGDTPLEYLTITMQDVIISSLSTGGSGGEDRLTESVTLNFGKFSVQYKEQTATGGTGGQPKFGWNITEHTPLA